MGDIHASFRDLSIIMRKIEEFPLQKIIFLGDYVDGNRNKLVDVLDTFISIERPAVFLKGNHEEEFLNFYNKYGTDEKKRGKILNHFGIGFDHLDWLRNNLVYSYQNEKAFFSHAGIDDTKILEEQTEYDLIYSAFRANLDHIDDSILYIQGHIPMKMVTNFGNHWFLDTGCGLGGYLSALVFPDMKVLCSNKKKEEVVIYGN